MFAKDFNRPFFFLLLMLTSTKSWTSQLSVYEKLDAFICISSEDDKYNVKGGIGTYLGVLTKEIKKSYPEMEVHWIAKSHNSTDFSEKDNKDGINRYYVSDTNPYENRPFCRHLALDESDSKALLEQQVFLNKANAKLGEILTSLQGKKIVIECGEWEGIAHQLFRVIADNNVLKAVRIHTPLAVTMVTNELSLSTTNKLQLLHEFEILDGADCISSCSLFIKDEVRKHLLGVDCLKGDQIQVIPNPVDSNNYKPGICSRIDSITKINTLLQQDFITQDTFNIYIVGSVETRKGAELVIDAIAQVAQALPQARFCFLGHHGGNESKNLTANTKLSPAMLLEKIPAQYRDQVAFAGYVDHAELPSIIQSGDAFPIMYLGDNFPGAVAEIALMEKPILALARGGVDEMLRNDNGEFIAYSLGSSLQTASNNLAQGLLSLYSQPELREIIGKNLNTLMRKKYNPAIIVKEIIDFYAMSLAGKNAI